MKQTLLFSYSCEKSCKKYDFYYVFIRNFVPKKYSFRIIAQFRTNLVSYWYENDAKFRAKKSFLSVLWKP